MVRRGSILAALVYSCRTISKMGLDMRVHTIEARQSGYAGRGDGATDGAVMVRDATAQSLACGINRPP
jgi:hypothetical protein